MYCSNDCIKRKFRARSGRGFRLLGSPWDPGGRGRGESVPSVEGSGVRGISVTGPHLSRRRAVGMPRSVPRKCLPLFLCSSFSLLAFLSSVSTRRAAMFSLVVYLQLLDSPARNKTKRKYNELTFNSRPRHAAPRRRDSFLTKAFSDQPRFYFKSLERSWQLTAAESASERFKIRPQFLIDLSVL